MASTTDANGRTTAVPVKLSELTGKTTAFQFVFIEAAPGIPTTTANTSTFFWPA